MLKVLYIGPAPLVIGGVSIHLRRLLHLLRNDIVYDFVDEGRTRYDEYFNLRSKKIGTYLSKVKNAEVVHIHSGIWQLRIFHVLVAKVLFRKKTIVTIHRDVNYEPFLWLTNLVMKLCDHVILVSKEGYDTISCGDKYHLLPAFLPPVIDEEPELHGDIVDFIAKARKNPKSVILISNAARFLVHNNEDLYGLDMCIEAMKSLGRDYFLIFVIAENPDHQDYVQRYKMLVSDYHLEDNILIYENSTSFVRLIMESDIVLRTTNTDGDAISVREAICLGKQVVASDVVRRPEGVILFRTRDVADLVVKIKSAVLSPVHVHAMETTDYRSVYLNFYGSIKN